MPETAPSNYSDNILPSVRDCSTQVVLVHDTRSNDSRFMHKLCHSLDAMNRLAQGETAHIALKTSLDNSNPGIVMSFHQKNRKKDFFRDWNLSGIKLYISFATSWKKKKKWIETIKYWKSLLHPFCTLLKFNKSHLTFP